MKFLSSLLSGHEGNVDSVIVFGGLGIMVFLGAAIYLLVIEHKPFDATGFLEVLGAVAGGKTLRDGVTGKPIGPPPEQVQ